MNDQQALLDLFAEASLVRDELEELTERANEALKRLNNAGLNISLVRISADQLARDVAEALALFSGQKTAPSKREQQQIIDSGIQVLKDALEGYADRGKETLGRVQK